MITHHRRKEAREFGGFGINLTEEPHRWFQDASGSHALINHTDTRLGVEKNRSGDAELVLGGFIRSLGPISPIYLAREYDAEGEPQGYSQVFDERFLNGKDLGVYRNLPESFRFTDVENALGGPSGSNAKRLIKRFVDLKIARSLGQGKGYAKMNGVHGGEQE